MASVSTAAKSPLNLLSWLGISVMDRYIASELMMPFLFGVGAFSSIGVTIGALFDLVRRVTEAGLPLTIALQVFVLKLPYFVSLAFPTSILLACLMVYGRLSSDSELIALRSCGVSIYRLVAPVIVLSLIMTGVTFVFNEAVVPSANYQASQILDQALNKKNPSFREKNILFQEFRDERREDNSKRKVLSRIFYAREFDGQQMKGLTILDFSQRGINQIVLSEAAVWNEGDKTWDFFKGTIYVVNRDGSYRNILRFDRQQLQLPRTPLDIAQNNRDSSEMNIGELQEQLKLIGQTGDQKDIRKIQLRIDQKMAFPFACLVFGLVGATLGTRPQRKARATGFGLSLIIIVSYYLFISICEALYQFEILSSLLAGWLPTIVGLAAGGVLLFRQSR